MALKPSIPDEPLRSPDQLNSAIRLTSASSWILLAVLTLCIGSVVVWSLVGRLLVYVHGPGVLEFTGGDIAVIQATAQGVVKEIKVKAGDAVKTGDVLFVVDQSTIQAQRDGAAKALKQQQQEVDNYEKTSAEDIKTRKANLDQQLDFLNTYLASQRKNETQLQEIYNGNLELVKKGLMTQPVLQQSMERLISVQQDISDKISSIAQLKQQQVEFENSISNNMSALKIDLATAEGTLNDYEAKLKFGGAILSPVSGTVSELATEVGKVVTEGEELGAVQSGLPVLTVQGYLPIGKGKQVEPGMTAEISPSSVERNIYGSIRGTVTEVSPLPVTESVLENSLGNPALAAQMMAQGAPIKVTVKLDTDAATKSGLRWTSSEGPPVQMSAGTTADVRVLTERRQPISLLLPVLQTWFTVQ
ncbi:NHLP bacteriocin system secretion protein [Roseibium litorale]|uniref:NHLP bacteriocin system secretion protein n=1 Tax=Roseibium litorale TaxID=2803841 RepID=A0ABR9CK82_9HYPH|nr:NHLP bacteriocin system secretion protein [Roseibium litorale]MBD8891262.1 NHLP bacteriocin system secretion protein [Roseibium litorale]